MKKYKLKEKYRRTLAIICLILSLLLLSLAIFRIVQWNIENKNSDNTVSNINNSTNINEIDDNENTNIINNDQKKDDDPYWDFIKTKLINVDFNNLLEQNPQTVGWINVQGTNINYPFVQTNDNEYYLNHSFDKSTNSAGWIFLDYRNNIKDLNRNTIIYGHGRVNKTMFGDLKNTLTSGWLKNKENYIVRLSTPTQNNLWQVFSIYKIPTTSDYIQTEFSNDQEFQNFAEMLLQRSEHDFKTSIDEKDKILTLSTCYNNKEKVVLHAKLIKVEKRV